MSNIVNNESKINIYTINKIFEVANKFEGEIYNKEDIEFMKVQADMGNPIAEFYYALVNLKNCFQDASIIVAEEYFKRYCMHTNSLVAGSMLIYPNFPVC